MGIRNDKLDNFKCILIFFVVFSHCLDAICRNCAGADFIRYVNDWIYSFHMPAFVFISGYFSHLDNPKYYYNSISRFLLPYLLINTVEQLLTSNPINPSNSMWTLWYLLSMFCWRALLPYAKNVRFSFIVFLIVALLAGKIDKIDYAFSLSRTICFFPYFLAGYLVKTKNQIWIFKIRKSIILPVFILSSACVIFLGYKGLLEGVFSMAYSYNNIGKTFTAGAALRFFAYVSGFIGIFAFLTFIPDKKSILSTIGMYTLPIYILHAIVIRLIRASSISVEPLPALFLALLLSACICLLFGNIYANKIDNGIFDSLSRVFLKECRYDYTGTE